MKNAHKLSFMFLFLIGFTTNIMAQTVFDREDFDDLNNGDKTAEELTTYWDTWTGNPGGSEDGTVSTTQAYSSPNSIEIVDGNDLLVYFKSDQTALTSGHYYYNHYMYVPTGHSGYFNLQAEKGSVWGIEVYVNDLVDGSYVYYGSSPSIDISTYVTLDAWMHFEIEVDLENDDATLWIDGTQVVNWTWSDCGSSELHVADYWGANSDYEAYFDDIDLEGGTYTYTKVGSGTSGDPYEISTNDDLIELSNTSGDWNKYFMQIADIAFDEDESQEDWNNSGSAGPVAGFSPIGNNTTKFTGNYNGDGFTISNLYIDRDSDVYIGLFGYTNGADISDIGIINCYITGNWYVGGLVGINDGSDISNSYSIGDITGELYIGGLVGINYSNINNSYSTSSVNGEQYVGGLVGVNQNADISNSYSTGDVTRSSGLNTNFGGFSGYIFNATIEHCYSIGSVYYDGASDPIDKGFVGHEFGTNTYTDNFFDSDASNQSTDAVGAATAKTTSEMKTQSTFTGWDFTSDWNIQSGSYISYPYLQAITYDTPGATPEVNPIPGLEANTPSVTTHATDDIAATTATGNGEITNIGAANADERGFLLWDYDNTDKETGDAGVTEYDETGTFVTGTFTGSLTSLSPNTHYNIRAYAENSAGSGYGDRDDFWTLAATPSAPTVDNATINTLDVTINVNGNPASVDYVIEETTTNQYVQASGALGGTEVWQDAATWGTVTITGLSAGTEYTFQVKARNDDTPQTETSYGASASGSTIGYPLLNTENITIIGNSKAKSGGEITETYGFDVLQKGVCWNTTGTPTTSDNITNDGSGDADYESIMGDLQVNQTYYVRAYATNSNGTGYGDEKTFIYTAIPTLPEWGLIVLGALVAVFAVRKLLIS